MREHLGHVYSSWRCLPKGWKPNRRKPTRRLPRHQRSRRRTVGICWNCDTLPLA